MDAAPPPIVRPDPAPGTRRPVTIVPTYWECDLKLKNGRLIVLRCRYSFDPWFGRRW